MAPTRYTLPTSQQTNQLYAGCAHTLLRVAKNWWTQSFAPDPHTIATIHILANST